MESITEQDLAYATPRERKLIALALEQAAEDVQTQVTVQSRGEEYGRNRATEKFKELGAQYLAATYPDGIVTWEDLSEDDQAYWKHEGEAVVRAAQRGGFKNRDGDTMGEWVYHRFGNRR